MEKIVNLLVMAWSEMRWAERFGPRMAAASACAVFAFLVLLGALICAVSAFWIYLEPRVGGAGASLWSAALLMVLSGVLGFSARAILRGDDGGRSGHRT